MVVESTGGDVVSCTAGCIYTSDNRETVKQCVRSRPWYDILISIASCCLGRVVECTHFMTLLCKGLLIHSIKLWGHGNGETTMMQCRHRPWSDLPNDILISISSGLGRVVECICFMAIICKGWLHSIKLCGHGNGDMMMQCGGGECRRPWSDLPDDILFSIASRLGRVECIRFMTVCKGWLHSIKPQGHHNHHLKPCLLVMEDADLGWVSLYTPFPSKTNYKLRIPELKETIFRFSKDGWILLSKISPSNPSHLFLFNMLTGAKFDLPDLNTLPGCFCGMCFTSTPGSSDFMVVIIRSVLVDRVTIYTYRPSPTCTDDDLKEEEKWTTECYESNNSSRTSFLGVSCNPIFYKGKLYCLDLFGHLGVFDPVCKNWTIVGDRPNNFVVNPPPPELRYAFDDDEEFALSFPPALCDFPYKSFMMNLEGEDLISVFVNDERKTAKKEVYVFRLDSCKMSWEKVDSLGMGELFVGLQTSISTIQVPYGSWNNLYFPGLKPNHCDDVIFSEVAYNSLETKVYDPSCSNVWRDPLKFTWIELPMSKWESIFYSKWKRT